MVLTANRYGFLHGLRILDLADEKGDFCTKLLADMGARVIKVEKPGGDASRNRGLFFKDTSRSKNSIPFFYNNTNKLGITLNVFNLVNKGRNGLATDTCIKEDSSF